MVLGLFDAPKSPQGGATVSLHERVSVGRYHSGGRVDGMAQLRALRGDEENDLVRPRARLDIFGKRENRVVYVAGGYEQRRNRIQHTRPVAVVLQGKDTPLFTGEFVLPLPPGYLLT